MNYIVYVSHLRSNKLYNKKSEILILNTFRLRFFYEGYNLGVVRVVLGKL